MNKWMRENRRPVGNLVLRRRNERESDEQGFEFDLSQGKVAVSGLSMRGPHDEECIVISNV